jgi:DNA-binding Lrp family transcriptional regulator
LNNGQYGWIKLAQRKKPVDDWLASLLTLRKCARSFPAAFGRALDIPRATALYRIRKLEEDGLVTGYIPMTVPTAFGTPYLVRININPKQYQFHEELQSTINSLVDFFETGIGHAPLSIYVYHDQEQDVWQVNCITMTSDIKRLTGTLYREQNIARESILTFLLNDAHGIPMYSYSSILDAKSYVNKTTEDE